MLSLLACFALIAPSALGQDVRSFLDSNPYTTSFWRVLRDYPDFLADLENTQDITILVPSGDALNGLNTTDDSATQRLLFYHVLQGSYTVEELLATGPFVPTLLTDARVSGGQRVQVSGTDDNAKIFSGLNHNASIDVENSNIAFDGGQAHIVDSVLTVPRSVSDTAIAAGLTSFAGAVNQSGVDVEAEDDCTFFVPTNDAFARAGFPLRNESAPDIDEIVLYHFINDTTPIYTPRIDHEQWISALRENVTMSYPGGDQLFINSARVTQSNILVANGVLHVIDQVLNPADAGDDPPAAPESSPAYPEANPTQHAPFTEDLDTSDAVAGVGDGPEATPVGTLSDAYEEPEGEGEEGAVENAARRRGTNLLGAASVAAAAVILL